MRCVRRAGDVATELAMAGLSIRSSRTTQAAWSSLLQSPTRSDNEEKHFIQFSKKVCMLELSGRSTEWPDDPTGAS